MDPDKPAAATPAATLEKHIMDSGIAKSEAEWWAKREIERLRADLALLGPVTTPLNGQQCAECGLECTDAWTYCPSCGAQDRVTDRSVHRHSR